jgi:hypothetical protein
MKSSRSAARKVARSCEMSAAAGMAAAEGVTATASRCVATAAATTTTMAAAASSATTTTVLCECRAAACQDQSQGTHRQQNAFALDIHLPLLNLTAACG